MSLHESWKVLVYGRRPRPTKRREPMVFPTSPVEWEKVPVKTRQRGPWRRAQPPAWAIARHARVRRRGERNNEEMHIPVEHTIRYGAIRPIPDRRGDMHLLVKDKSGRR